jgi:hypothetical protein
VERVHRQQVPGGPVGGAAGAAWPPPGGDSGWWMGMTSDGPPGVWRLLVGVPTTGTSLGV